MTTQTTQPTPASISERAMLVNLSIRQWSAQKTDKRVTREVADSHGSDVSMGRYNKSLVAKSALDKIKRIATDARTFHYARTLPWADDGARILSSAGYLDYAQQMRRYSDAFGAAIDELCEETTYDALVADARVRLNGLFNPADYPTLRQLRARFGFDMRVLPVPSGADFRVQLGDAETAAIQSHIEQTVRASIDAAMADVWSRIRTALSHLSTSLNEYQVTDDGVQHPFRDSVIGNIRSLVAILPSLNITGDPDLDAITAEIAQSIAPCEPDSLRECTSFRADTARRADEILAKMEAFV